MPTKIILHFETVLGQAMVATCQMEFKKKNKKRTGNNPCFLESYAINLIYPRIRENFDYWRWSPTLISEKFRTARQIRNGFWHASFCAKKPTTTQEIAQFNCANDAETKAETQYTTNGSCQRVSSINFIFGTIFRFLLENEFLVFT